MALAPNICGRVWFSSWLLIGEFCGVAPASVLEPKPVLAGGGIAAGDVQGDSDLPVELAADEKGEAVDVEEK